jgi:hypothetical protein
MSSLTTLVVKDRRIDFALPKECVTLVGGKHINYTNQSFQMSSLGSGASLSVTIADTQALLRTSYLKFSCVVNVSGTTTFGGATGILQYGYFGLNSNPLWKLINNIQLTQQLIYKHDIVNHNMLIGVCMELLQLFTTMFVIIIQLH